MNMQQRSMQAPGTANTLGNVRFTTTLQRPLPRRTSLRVLSVAQPHRKLASAKPKESIAASWGFSKGSLSMLGLGALAGGGLFGSNFDIAGPGSVLEALAVLAAVVGFHEAGHFAAARIQNIHVNKFAIGFGPALITYQGGEVEYTLRAFPLGGFVAFPDDDPDSKYPADDPDLLRNRPVLDRAIVTSAGVIANVIFAYTLCVVQAGTVGVTEPTYYPGVKLGSILPATVAESAGLQRGDILLSFGDLKIAPSPNAVNDVVDYISTRPGKTANVELIREGKKMELQLTPAEMPDGSGRIGVSLGLNMKVDKIKADDIGSALRLGATDFKSLFGTVVGGLGQFVNNFKQTAERVSGPVAILAVGSEVARTDVSGLYQFAALININLAVVNLLPLPALDGGYLALQFLEAVRGGKKLEKGLEQGIMASGFLLLTSVGMFLIVRDALSLLKI